MRFHLPHTSTEMHSGAVISRSLVARADGVYKPGAIPGSPRALHPAAARGRPGRRETGRDGEGGRLQAGFGGGRYLGERSSRPLRYRPRGIIMGHNCINIMLINN